MIDIYNAENDAKQKLIFILNFDISQLTQLIRQKRNFINEIQEEINNNNNKINLINENLPTIINE